MRRSLTKLSAGRITEMYLAGEIDEFQVPRKHETFVLRELDRCRGTFAGKVALRKAEALRAVQTCHCGFRFIASECPACRMRRAK